MEFAGRSASGQRVLGLVPGGALATSVLAHKDLVWPLPDEWSLEEACTVPRTYSLVSIIIAMLYDYNHYNFYAFNVLFFLLFLFYFYVLFLF